MSNKLIDKELIVPVIESTGDKTYRLVKTALAAIPGGGGVAVELFTSIIDAPMEKRRLQWMIEVTTTINEFLINKNHTIESLQNDEVFITTLLQSSNAAMRQHSEEKRLALRNVVVNSVLKPDLSEWKKDVFLNMIDRYSVLHLAMLRVANEERDWLADAFFKNKGRHKGIKAVLLNEYPKLAVDIKYADIVWDELYREKFVTEEVFDRITESIGKYGTKKLTTPIAQEFIEFISIPK